MQGPSWQAIGVVSQIVMGLMAFILYLVHFLYIRQREATSQTDRILQGLQRDIATQAEYSDKLRARITELERGANAPKAE